MYFDNSIVIKKYEFNFLKESKSLNIAYGVDANFLYGAAISISSVLLNNKNLHFTFHLFTDYINEDFLIKLEQLSKQYQTKIIIGLISCDFLKVLPTTKNWTYATYFRFIIFDLCQALCNKLLYLDADVICKGNVQYLFEYQFNDELVAAVRDGTPEFWQERSKALSKPNLKNGYFNAGVMLINLNEFRTLNIVEKAMNFLFDVKFQKKLKFQDQDVLNFLLCERVYFIDRIYNSQTSINFELASGKNKFYAHSNIDEDTIFIHYIGPTKPWHNWTNGYPINKFFLIAKQESPWREDYLQKPTSTSLIRYQAKHFAHQNKIISSYASYLKYFILKIFKF